MAARPLPDQALLLKLLRYEPDTGKLFWRERTPNMFEPCCVSIEHAAANWNARCAGKPALNANSGNGYKEGALHNRKVYAHRVIWKMITGEDPMFVDHINGDRSDNRFCNLRSVDRLQNMQNTGLRHTNRSGCPGVRWTPKIRKWQARITVNKRIMLLGAFVTLEDAIRVRRAAEREYGFHPNHGQQRQQY
jgi:hypothetical protein